ncbi:MAG: hypothetical protein FJ029_02080 [Actinobacteria bacterium]|nr:hypothetical protein [Actinomycetota bacterium]
MSLSGGFLEAPPDGPVRPVRHRTRAADREFVGRRQLALWLTMAESIWSLSPVDSDQALLSARLADEIEHLLLTRAAGAASQPRPKPRSPRSSAL